MSIIVRDKDGNRKKIAGVGLPGPAGKSAYQYAVEAGFTGTEAEFAALVGWISNPNLLINWDFRHPVNRNGKSSYTTNPGAPIYSIDRWKIWGQTRTTDTLVINEGYITFKTNVYGGFLQYIESKGLGGCNLNFSILCRSTSPVKFWLSVTSVDSEARETSVISTYFDVTTDFSLTSVPVAIPVLEDSETLGIKFLNASEVDIVFDLKAVKLELGSQQTLAHQDASGNWVLNDPPNYDMQYALCSLYSPITGERVRYPHSNPNLLDNAYWADRDAIINQRGQMEYTGTGYTIDRWMTTDGPLTIDIKEDSVTITNTSDSTEGYFFQRLDEIAESVNGRDVTLSFLTVDGTLYSGTVTFSTEEEKAFFIINDENLRVYLGREKAHPLVCVIGVKAGKTLSIKAAKLELGPVQTLAHQDENENWVLNDPPPNKALELAKCQRYFCNLLAQDTANYTLLGLARADTSTTAFAEIPIPCVFRSNPTIITGGLFHLSGIPVESMALNNYRTGLLTVNVHVAGGLTTGSVYMLQKSENSSFLLDANL